MAMLTRDTFPLVLKARAFFPLANIIPAAARPEENNLPKPWNQSTEGLLLNNLIEVVTVGSSNKDEGASLHLPILIGFDTGLGTYSGQKADTPKESPTYLYFFSSRKAIKLRKWLHLATEESFCQPISILTSFLPLTRLWLH